MGRTLGSNGILDKANGLEWGSPYFAQPKLKTNEVCFLSYFKISNK